MLTSCIGSVLLMIQEGAFECKACSCMCRWIYEDEGCISSASATKSPLNRQYQDRPLDLAGGASDKP